LRVKSGYSQEDMIGFGFSARHWQQVEAGRPITMTTLLRICDTFHPRFMRLSSRLAAALRRCTVQRLKWRTFHREYHDYRKCPLASGGASWGRETRQNTAPMQTPRMRLEAYFFWAAARNRRTCVTEAKAVYAYV